MAEAGRILIADDDKVSLSVTAGLLKKHGYTCTCVTDGTSAQEQLDTYSYDLVISDIKMPGNFELDLIKTLAQSPLDTPVPVIVVTGHPSLSSALQSIQLAVAGYLVKPFAPDELLTQVRNVIANTRAAQALRDSEERYRNLFENASEALVTMNAAGIITRMNKRFAQLLGYDHTDQDKILGQHYRHVVMTNSAGMADHDLQRLLSSTDLDHASQTFELELLRKDGSPTPVEARYSAIHTQDGAAIGFQASHRDISTRKELERQRAELLAMLTHDIRNPLGVILGYTQMLLEGAREQAHQSLQSNDIATDAEMNANILERILCNTLTVHSLVANYLDLSKIEAGQLSIAKQPVQLNSILEQVCTKYETAARNGNITLSLCLSDHLPHIRGDALALERVFANLVSNALKFTPAHGKVILSTDQRNGSIVATVTDTGSGMTQEEIPTLFEKYRRAKKDQSKEGIGLGLFIVKTLVSQHNGRIAVESAPGRGCSFQLFFPNSEYVADAA